MTNSGRKLVCAFIVSAAMASASFAQDIDPLLRATDAMVPRSQAAALPASRFSVSRGIGIVEDDGQSYWPGATANFQAPATFRLTPTANNTFMAQRVAYSFDDPAGGKVIMDGAVRPVISYVDANYVTYTLPAPLTFAGAQYSTLSVSLWGAVAFGAADTTQVNYDPTVVSSMFRIPTIAVWYELFYYPSDARVIAKSKPSSTVITWQNVLSRHSLTRATFQVELFNSGDIQLSYQTLPLDHGLVGVSTGKETATHQSASLLAFGDVPPFMNLAQATFDDYGGVIGGVTLKLGTAPPATMAANESYQYILVVNGTPVIGALVTAGPKAAILIPSAATPAFPGAQINSWEVRLSGDTLSFRFPESSLEPFLSGGSNTWALTSTRFGGAGFVQHTVTQTAPLSLSVRHTLLPASIGPSVEIPAEVFHYMPGQWDTDRIRESIAAYLAANGQSGVDTFRFFPTVYDDGLRHANFAGTYPRQKNTAGVGVVPARTECDCHYGGEFSSVSESLMTETTTMVALTHELGHEYLFYADYRGSDGAVNGAWRDAGVPCFGGAHPNGGLITTSMFANEQADATISVMGGSLGGSVQLDTPRFGFSRLEMYLMGLAAASEVGPVTFVQGNTPTHITIDQVIAANGPRTPAYVSGQTRTFRVPTFVVKRQGETVSDAQLQQLQALLWKWQSRFWHETDRRARANLTLDGGCAFTLSEVAVKGLVAGGASDVSVLAGSGCAWTATANSPWITVSGGASGSGDGVVHYAFSANTTGAARTGTITIAGQPYTISQPPSQRRRPVR